MIPAGPGATLGGPSSNSFPAHPAVCVPGTNLEPFSSANPDTSVVVPARVPPPARAPLRRHVSLATSLTNPGPPSERQVVSTQQFLASPSSLPSMTSKSHRFFYRNKVPRKTGRPVLPPLRGGLSISPSLALEARLLLLVQINRHPPESRRCRRMELVQ